MHSSYNWVQWRALVTTTMNLLFSIHDEFLKQFSFFFFSFFAWGESESTLSLKGSVGGI
jgi:hypothetical protein